MGEEGDCGDDRHVTDDHHDEGHHHDATQREEVGRVVAAASVRLQRLRLPDHGDGDGSGVDDGEGQDDGRRQNESLSSLRSRVLQVLPDDVLGLWGHADL